MVDYPLSGDGPFRHTDSFNSYLSREGSDKSPMAKTTTNHTKNKWSSRNSGVK